MNCLSPLIHPLRLCLVLCLASTGGIASAQTRIDRSSVPSPYEGYDDADRYERAQRYERAARRGAIDADGRYRPRGGGPAEGYPPTGYPTRGYRYDFDPYSDDYAYVPGGVYGGPAYADRGDRWEDEWYEEGRYEYDAYTGEVYDYDPRFRSDYAYSVDGQAHYAVEGSHYDRGYTGYGEVSDLYQRDLNIDPYAGWDGYYTDDWWDDIGVYNRWYGW